ncbi:3034_t:CDS:1, partial [Paraglomus occultum]
MTRVSKLTKDAPKCAGSDYTDSRSRKVISHTEAQSISTMKRSSDYGNQSHDNIKKARFGQGGYGSYSLSASGMRNDLSQGSSASDLYSHQFPPVSPSAMMMGNHSYSQGNPGFHHHHGHQGGHFAAMGTYQHAPQYAASMGQYTPTVSSMVPQFSGAFSSAQFPGYQQAAVASVTNSTGRTVYLGNIPAEVPVDEILNQVKVGPIESVRILPDK